MSVHWQSLVRLWHLGGPPGTTSPFPWLTPREAGLFIAKRIETLKTFEQVQAAALQKRDKLQAGLVVMIHPFYMGAHT